jgi:hypothetical protein
MGGQSKEREWHIKAIQRESVVRGAPLFTGVDSRVKPVTSTGMFPRPDLDKAETHRPMVMCANCNFLVHGL